MIPVYVIMALVLIGLPVLLGKLTGKNPMEILFGDRVNNTLFGKKKKEDPSTETDEKGGTRSESSGKKGEKGKTPSIQRNSSRQELMQTISELLSYARKNHFFCIVPGTLQHGDEVATLAVLIVTRCSVLGFNCFGYGGTVYAGSGDDAWRQVLNGEEKKIDSPVSRNKKQKEILDAVLKECGYLNIRTEIYGVFTASGVILKDHRNTRCCSQKVLMEILKGSHFMEDSGVDPKKIGRTLETHIKKQDSKS